MESYATIKNKNVRAFILKNLICHFGLSQVIIADNGSQFISDSFKTFYSEWKIQLYDSTSRHPQKNRQTKATNKILLNIIKKTLNGSKGK